MARAVGVQLDNAEVRDMIVRLDINTFEIESVRIKSI